MNKLESLTETPRLQAINKAKKNIGKSYNFDSGNGLVTQVYFCDWRRRLVFVTHTPAGFQII